MNRKILAFNDALLPHQKPSAIREAKDALEREIAEFEASAHSALVDEVERESERRSVEFERMKKEKRTRRKAEGKPRKKIKRIAKTGKVF